MKRINELTESEAKEALSSIFNVLFHDYDEDRIDPDCEWDGDTLPNIAAFVEAFVERVNADHGDDPSVRTQNILSHLRTEATIVQSFFERYGPAMESDADEEVWDQVYEEMGL